ncbi:hypothetical protein BASA81_006636 [Batrachochytrium salamandrivorans]|nr:hypothetical protein BASA81_006636 [Batrachochytrium salamandrivorans]
MKSVVLVFAANTDCGKTLLSAGLVRAALNQSRQVRYIKPVQTGFDFDAAKIKQRNAQFPSPLLQTETLFHFNEPVSPPSPPIDSSSKFRSPAVSTFAPNSTK